jgi:hypothetical protein
MSVVDYVRVPTRKIGLIDPDQSSTSFPSPVANVTLRRGRRLTWLLPHDGLLSADHLTDRGVWMGSDSAVPTGSTPRGKSGVQRTTSRKCDRRGGRASGYRGTAAVARTGSHTGKSSHVRPFAATSKPIDSSHKTAKASRPAISCLGASRTPQLADHHPRHPAGRPRNPHRRRHSSAIKQRQFQFSFRSRSREALASARLGLCVRRWVR